jgi:hypothetical protein
MEISVPSMVAELAWSGAASALGSAAKAEATTTRRRRVSIEPMTAPAFRAGDGGVDPFASTTALGRS